MLRLFAAAILIPLLFMPAYAFEGNAKERLEKWARAVEEGSIPFIQKRYLSILPRPIESQGEIILEGDDVLLWRQNSPIEVELRLTSNGIEGAGQNYGADINATVAPIAQAITDVFYGRFEQLNMLFEIGEQGETIILTPHTGVLKRIMKRIELSGAQHLQLIKLVEHNDDATIIALQSGGMD